MSHKGALIAGGAILLGIVAVAAVASADEPAPGRKSGGGRATPKRGSRRPTEEEEEGYGTRWSEACNGYDTSIQVLEGQRDSVKAGLVDIDAALMAASMNDDYEAVLQWETARKGQKQVLANIDSQIAGLDAKIDAECNGEDIA
jgi:hypothetical protein